MNEQNSENTPTVLEQVINSLEKEMIRCGEKIKVAEEPEKYGLMEKINSAFRETYDLYLSTREVPEKRLKQIAKIYSKIANNYSGK